MIPPAPSDPFVWRDFEGRPGLVCRPLEALVSHVFTTSAWPLGARSPREPEGEQWRTVAAAVGVAHDRLVRVRQVHGASVFVAKAGAASGPAEADIILTGDDGLAAVVQVADCVPLLMADRRRGVVAAVHAGWRGMAARAPQAAVRGLAREFGTRPADVVAALGPSIGACCYEVGPDVRECFAAAGFTDASLRRWFAGEPARIEGNPPLPSVEARTARADRWFFDGWRATAEQIVEAGVPAGQVFAVGLCTASHPRVFCSYRRDGAPSGRLDGAIRCGQRP
jgi:YfiH family protein